MAWAMAAGVVKSIAAAFGGTVGGVTKGRDDRSVVKSMVVLLSAVGATFDGKLSTVDEEE